MVDKTLKKLEERIRTADGTNDKRREDLLALVAELRAELGSVATTEPDQAVALAAAAATGVPRDPDSDDDDDSDDDGGIEEALLEFETAHPTAVGLVRRFLNTLSDAGI